MSNKNRNSRDAAEQRNRELELSAHNHNRGNPVVPGIFHQPSPLARNLLAEFDAVADRAQDPNPGAAPYDGSDELAGPSSPRN